MWFNGPATGCERSLSAHHILSRLLIVNSHEPISSLSIVSVVEALDLFICLMLFTESRHALCCRSPVQCFGRRSRRILCICWTGNGPLSWLLYLCSSMRLSEKVCHLYILALVCWYYWSLWWALAQPLILHPIESFFDVEFFPGWFCWFIQPPQLFIFFFLY